MNQMMGVQFEERPAQSRHYASEHLWVRETFARAL